MPWTAPRNWGVGDLVTAALLNTHLRDNLNMLRKPPAARVYPTVNTSVLSGSVTTLSFNTARYNVTSPGLALPFSAPSPSLVAPQAGIYLITAHLLWTTNSTGLRVIQLVRTGSPPIHFGWQIVPANESTHMAISSVIDLNQNEQVWVQVYQNSGVTLEVIAQGISPGFTMTYLGEK